MQKIIHFSYKHHQQYVFFDSSHLFLYFRGNKFRKIIEYEQKCSISSFVWKQSRVGTYRCNRGFGRVWIHHHIHSGLFDGFVGKRAEVAKRWKEFEDVVLKLDNRFDGNLANVNIEDLPIPYVLIATDFERGEEKVFRSGNLNQLIRASISIPVVFRPVSYQDMLLTDGGTCNPLPLNRVKRTTNDILVSINVNAPIKQAQHKTPQDTSFIRIIDHLIEKHYHKAFGGVLEKLLYEKEHSLVKFFNELAEKDMPLAELNYLNIINRITDIMLVQNSQLMKQLCPADMSVDIPNNRWGRYDYDHAQEIIDYGYKAMKAEIERFEKQAVK